MSTELNTMQTLQDRVRERIQAQFVELIPDTMFAALTKAAIDSWVANDLPKMVKEMLNEHARTMLRREFEKPEWQEQWLNGQQIGSQAMVEVMKAAAPDLVAAMFARMGQEFINQLRYR